MGTPGERSSKEKNGGKATGAQCQPPIEHPAVGTRKNILDLDPDEMDLLIDAWIYIQHNPPDPEDNPNTASFFTIAGFHGEPFRGAGYGNASWWGGYCNHGNILFPTWHRAYLLCLENALRKAPGCENIRLPYWNEVQWPGSTPFPGVLPPTKPPCPSHPIPRIFLQKKYVYHRNRREIVDNPLYSYWLQRKITDQLIANSSVAGSDVDYSKPKNYETVRYPFSGLVGTSDSDTTKAHNELMKILGEEKTTELLQSNVTNWLTGKAMNDHGADLSHGWGAQTDYFQSLYAPDYTVYSNTTSAQRYNDDIFDDTAEDDTPKDDTPEGKGKPAVVHKQAVVPIESPHNAIHLAVGGFEIPGVQSYSFVSGANGDMGENDTAAFDPIFFFHHCFIDLMFWEWQRKHGGPENSLTIREKYPGTNSVDSQGPTPGTPGGTWLTLDTPLDPFTDKEGNPLTSNKVADISKLGYKYHDSLTNALRKLPDQLVGTTDLDAHIRISGLSRGDARGSFFLSAWADNDDGDSELVAVVPVLSRWRVGGCANCSTHLNVTAIASVGMRLSEAQSRNFGVLVHTRDRRYGHPKLGGKMPNFSLGNLKST
jgi:tyrosinase